MTKVSAICLQKDLDVALHALSKFGQFQPEPSSNVKLGSYRELTDETERIHTKIDSLAQRLKIDTSPSRTGMFRYEAISRTKLTVDNWNSLLQSVGNEVSTVETEVHSALQLREDIGREEAELQKQLRTLETLSSFNIDPRLLTEGLVRCVAARVPLKNVVAMGRSLAKFPAVYYYKPIDSEAAFAFVATMTRDSQAVDLVFEANELQLMPSLEIEQSPREFMLEVQGKLAQLSLRKKDAEQRVESVLEKYGRRLLVLREVVSNFSRILRIKGTALSRGQLTEVVGFVPESSVPGLEDRLKTSLNDRFLLFSSKHAKSEDPPTLLRNPSFIKPFEKITALYGMPHYDEIDPTPLMALTFPFIFGLMFGDVGHGVILFLFGLMASFLVKGREGWKSLFRVLAACGLGSIFAGLLFGEAFGKQAFRPLWFDPFQNITLVLIFALLVGVVHIITGFIVNFANFMIKREYIDAFTVSLIRSIFYVEAIYFLLAYQLNFNLWLRGPIYYLFGTLVFLFLGKPVIASLLKRGKFFSVLGERLFEGTELLLMLISNTVSYARILALLIAHWALLTVTYALSDLVAPASVIGQVTAFIITVSGNVFVLAFEALIVLVATLRLHFYEWFSKFYEGTGTVFQPFKYQEKYVEIEVTEKTKTSKQG